MPSKDYAIAFNMCCRDIQYKMLEMVRQCIFDDISQIVNLPRSLIRVRLFPFVALSISSVLTVLFRSYNTTHNRVLGGVHTCFSRQHIKFKPTHDLFQIQYECHFWIDAFRQIVKSDCLKAFRCLLKNLKIFSLICSLYNQRNDLLPTTFSFCGSRSRHEQIKEKSGAIQ